MSAMGGVIPVRSPAEIEADSSGNGDGRGGVVIPLRVDRQTPVEQSVELHPISPELALVDPDLARAARELLPDRPRFAAVPATFVERLDEAPEPVRRGRLRRLLTLTELVALAAGLMLLIGPAPTPRQAQSVARPEGSPATATPTAAPTATAAPAPMPVKKAAKPATPAAIHAPSLPGQTFVWVATPGASAYEFQLFQNGERIFRGRVVKPRLVLPGRWRQDGRPYALAPGDYRWYVWPVSSQTKRQAGVATVQAKLVIEGQPR